jgi:tRNA threonylcarbamoyladenosine biosynthesis protein TsaB
MVTRSVVLGMDTCTKWLNLALVDGAGEVLGEVHEEVRTHATRLVAGIESLLPVGSPERASLTAIGVVLGPGSFTGLRVGLAAAEGLSAALGLPVFGIDSLTALASCSRADGEGLALLDARRNQVYAARFSRGGGTLTPLGEPAAVAPGDLRNVVSSCGWAIGDGVGLVEGWPDRCLLQSAVPNLAVPAARMAMKALRDGFAPTALTPLYVRPPDVREPGEKELKSLGAGEPGKKDLESWGAGELEKTRR